MRSSHDRLNSKHLTNAMWQPYLDSVALSVCVRRCFSPSPHLAPSDLFCFPLFYFQQTFIPVLLFPFCLSVYPSFTSLAASTTCLATLLHWHWQEVMPSRHCCKIENEDKLFLIMCLLDSVTVSEHKELKKVHVFYKYTHTYL